MKRLPLLVLLALAISVALPVLSLSLETGGILFREDFNDTEKWKSFFFPKIPKHSTYSVENIGGEPVLRTESKASASAIVYEDAFSVSEYPNARWRWKVASLLRNADPARKSGDDYPVRIYVMFEYDPDTAGLGDRIVYGLAKSRFGSYPPHSSLSYVWSSRATSERIFSSPYTDKAKMVVLRAGPKELNTWQEEAVNMLEDYRTAFGVEPPARARIAIMNDSDNTGESAVSWVDFIEVHR